MADDSAKKGGENAQSSTTGQNAPYEVLARKYRPTSFEDLIGHGAMVQTLSNAFATGRIAHAYVLTGVRGVGKTTTARILARALNYAPNDEASDEEDGPSIDLREEGKHCRAIAESRHPDVLEMDAASRTGVGDIRDLIEGVRYAPVEARYKVYIIDEVHMLSTAAFNALLKTLEEPPPHVKFIFATTEIRKLPVTVLSRCQRFDLRRIEPSLLKNHLAGIAEKEGVSVAEEGLEMIARAAEGSVRDGLSILDQALIQHGRDTETPVGAETIRDMLGLADRTQVWSLVNAVFAGEAATAMELFRTQYNAGADPTVVLRDMLDVTHLASRTKAAGPEAASHGPNGDADAERATALANGLSMAALTRGWSLLMKGLSETQIAPDPAAAAEMTLIRLAYAADLPTPDEALRILKSGAAPAQSANSSSPAPSPSNTPPPSNGPTRSSNSATIDSTPPPTRSGRSGGAQAERQPQTAPEMVAASTPRLASFEDVVHLAGAKLDAKLKVELESFIHIVAFEQGRIELRLAEGAPTDLPGRLVQKLKEWTSDVWTVTVNAGAKGAATMRDARFAEVMAHPLVKSAMDVFPDAEIITIRDVESEGPLSLASDLLNGDSENDDDPVDDPVTE